MGVSRVVVQSVGSASPAASLLLARALPFSREHLARCVYRAPSVLLDRLPEAEAITIRDLLVRTGLDVQVDDAEAAPPESGPLHEVAVYVTDAQRLREVAAEVARFVGCTPARAVELVCASPAVVLAQVSQNTVQALAERLAPLGAEVDASAIDDARYDVLVDDQQADLRRRLVAALRQAGIEAATEGPLLAAGVDRRCAHALWQRHGQQDGWRLLDQAFQRFDLWLDEPVEGAAAVDALLACTGMPRALVPQVNRALPLLLLESIPAAAARAQLLALHAAGVTASARLVTLSRWDLSLHAVADARAAALVLSRVGGLDEAASAAALLRLPARLQASLTLPRARWLVAELAAVGARAELEPR